MDGLTQIVLLIFVLGLSGFVALMTYVKLDDRKREREWRRQQEQRR